MHFSGIPAEEAYTPQMAMEALERNFSGVFWENNVAEESFSWLCEVFLSKVKLYCCICCTNECEVFACFFVTDGADNHPVKLAHVQQRSILDVLKESLKDHSEREEGENAVRYKLVIDSSEDSSMMRLLFTFGVLQRNNTRINVCSASQETTSHRTKVRRKIK